MKAIYEVWSFVTQQHNRITGTDGVFTSMINKFIKIKQETFGWSKHCRTEEAKNKYIEEFLEREDIKLAQDIINAKISSRRE